MRLLSLEPWVNPAAFLGGCSKGGSPLGGPGEFPPEKFENYRSPEIQFPVWLKKGKTFFKKKKGRNILKLNKAPSKSGRVQGINGCIKRH